MKKNSAESWKKHIFSVESRKQTPIPDPLSLGNTVCGNSFEFPTQIGEMGYSSFGCEVIPSQQLEIDKR